MKKLMLGVCCLSVIAIVGGCKQENQNVTHSEGEVTEMSKNSGSSMPETTVEVKKELSLTTEEMEKWVREVLVFSDRWNDDYVISTAINQTDDMLYSQVGKPQTGSDYVFRINSVGELEAKIGNMNYDFKTVSTTYLVMDVSKEELIKVFGEEIEPPTIAEDKINSFDEAVAYVLDNEALWNQSDYKVQGHREDEMATKLHSNEIGENYSVSILIDKPIYPQLDKGSLSFVVYKDGRIDQQIRPTGVDFAVLLDPSGGKEKTMVNYSEIERYD